MNRGNLIMVDTGKYHEWKLCTNTPTCVKNVLAKKRTQGVYFIKQTYGKSCDLKVAIHECEQCESCDLKLVTKSVKFRSHPEMDNIP